MSLSKIKYLSDKRIADLNKLGIHTLEDLASNFPKSYLDNTPINTDIWEI